MVCSSLKRSMSEVWDPLVMQKRSNVDHCHGGMYSRTAAFLAGLQAREGIFLIKVAKSTYGAKEHIRANIPQLLPASRRSNQNGAATAMSVRGFHRIHKVQVALLGAHVHLHTPVAERAQYTSGSRKPGQPMHSETHTIPQGSAESALSQRDKPPACPS